MYLVRGRESRFRIGGSEHLWSDHANLTRHLHTEGSIKRLRLWLAAFALVRASVSSAQVTVIGAGQLVDPAFDDTQRACDYVGTAT